jgi:hypothetical protein
MNRVAYPISSRLGLLLVAVIGLVPPSSSLAQTDTRQYSNALVPISDPKPLLADHPQFVEPIVGGMRFESPTLVDDPGADLDVRAWRWSYNARAIIEVPNRLRSDRTTIVVVHPWGIDDGQGWVTPQPAGAAFQCTPEKNALVLEHGRLVINPLLKRLRDQVQVVAYSLPGTEDPIRRKIYRSARGEPTEADRVEGRRELGAKLNAFSYRGNPLPSSIVVDPERPTLAYFQAFPGLDAGTQYDPKGFWELPIPVMKTIDTGPRDVVFYDAEGYPLLRDFLKKQGVRHVLLAGYNTDMCVCSTTAGYENLRKDFDVFLVGDATIATFPAHSSPRFATSTAVSFASLNLFITQSSWIRQQPAKPR